MSFTGSPAPDRLARQAPFAAAWLYHPPSLFALAAVLTAALTLAAHFLRAAEAGHPITFANVAALITLLRFPTIDRRWALAGAATGFAVTYTVIAASPAIAVIRPMANLLEIILALAAAERWCNRAVPLSAPQNLAVMLLVAGALAPIAAATFGAGAVALIDGAPFLPLQRDWFAADAFGTIIAGPLFLVGSVTRGRDLIWSRRCYEIVPIAAVVAGVTFLIFEIAHIPALFLIFPALTLATFRLRLLGAAMGIVIVAAIATMETLRGVGPIAAQFADLAQRQLYLDVFLSVIVIAKMPVAAILVEREETTRRVADSERQYRLLADHSNDMIVRIGLDGVRRFVSPASRTILGFAPEELIGGTPIADIHADDRARVASVWQSLLDGAVNPICAYRQRCRDGSYVWLEATYSLLCDDSGAPAEFVASVRDIGRRRAAELETEAAMAKLQESHRLISMAESLAGIGHWRLDSVANTLVWSEEVFRIHGYPLDQPPPLDQAIAFYHPDDREIVRSSLRRALDDGSPWTVRARLIRPDGSIRHVETSGQAERAPNGAIVGVVGIFRDVSEEVAAAAELIAARDAAKASAEARSTFLAIMSHEIRTPMTGVLGMIELLRHDPPAEERERFFTNLEQSATLLMKVLDDVLAFSKIESGHLRLESTGFDIVDVCRTTLGLFQHAAISKRLVLHFDEPPTSDTYLRGDPIRLRQILSNLISNAIKFTDQGSVQLRLRLAAAGAQRRVRLEVIDTGIGMTADAIDRVFAPFVQADASTARRFGGTGLGLAITKRLVEAMDGTIVIDSQPAAGTRFVIDVTFDAVAREMRASDTPTVRPSRALSILLAEDNAINRTLIETLVRRAGHNIRSVENGRQAVQTAAQEPFDLILMDIRMPEMDGLAATRIIRAQDGPCHRTPIVALTADIVDARRDRYGTAEFTDLLAKPIDPTVFGDQIVRLADATSPPTFGAAHAPAREPLIDDRRLARVRQAIGDAQFDGILAMMRSELTTRPARIAQLIAHDRHAEAAAEAHAMRGAMAGVGAMRVAGLAQRIETACTAGASTVDLARQLIEDADRTLDALASVTRTLLGSVAERPLKEIRDRRDDVAGR